MQRKEPGYVYILTNPSFREDWVKIGKSSRPVDVRSKELDNTAVPLPFEIFATMKTVKYNEVEKLVHKTIDRLTDRKVSGPVFCDTDGTPMAIEKYRQKFYAALDACSIENPVIETNRRKYTPHSCRHTFSTLMKAVQAPDKDKLALIGHTSTEMLRHYQDVDLEGLRKITDAI